MSIGHDATKGWWTASIVRDGTGSPRHESERAPITGLDHPVGMPVPAAPRHGGKNRAEPQRPGCEGVEESMGPICPFDPWMEQSGRAGSSGARARRIDLTPWE